MVQTQVGKWGNSLAVRIPGSYAKDLDLKEGTVTEEGVRLAFTLPAGSYATVLLREVSKADELSAEEDV